MNKLIFCRRKVTVPKWWLGMQDATYQVSRQSAQWFWRRFYNVFTIYGHGSHLDNVTWTKYINFLSPFTRRLHMKFKWKWSSSFNEEAFWKCWQTTDVTSGQGHRMTLTSRIPWGEILMHYCTKEHNSNQNMHFFQFFCSKAYGTDFDPAIK